MSTPSSSVLQFFASLASRRYRENDLSDVTWSMCQAVPGFTAALCESLGLAPMASDPIEAVREYPLRNGGGRPDFCFLGEAETPLLFVEVKLNDRSYHFKQYSEASSPGARLVLVTNHQLDGPAAQEARSFGWTVVGWLELLHKLSSRDFGDDQSLVHAYLSFAGRLCGARRMEKVHFDNESLYSLGLMHELLEQTIRRYQDPQANVSPYNTSRAFSATSTGAYYHLQLPEPSAREAWLFLGVVYEQPIPFLTIAADKDWNEALVAVLMKHLAQEVAGVLVHEYPDRSGVDIKMAPEAFEKFKASTPSEQESQLLTWFSAANAFVIECLRAC